MTFSIEKCDGYQAWMTDYDAALEAWCLQHGYPAQRYDDGMRIEVHSRSQAAYLQVTWGNL
jgi:hypothetical protein